jgi:molybdopterin synthase catalytic subunit
MREAGYYLVTKENIHIQHLIEWVKDTKAGAICTFMGTVREWTDGRKTTHLEYEAYKEMAEKELAMIGRGILEKHDILKIAIVHRVGRLYIGEIAVMVAVSSPHRTPSFASCRDAMERIKKFVPIWKKEVNQGASFWVGQQSKG